MMHTFKGRELLTLAELTPEEITHVLDVAEHHKVPAFVVGPPPGASCLERSFPP